MRCIRSKVIEEFEKGWIGPNLGCEYHPCHYKGQDCTYCYCPFYPCNDTDMGKTLISKRGDREVWDCSDCLFIHRTDVCRFVSDEVERLGIDDPDDVRLRDIFMEAKERFFRLGRSIMILGATSDAGKSLMTAAVCRLISSMGYTVTPLKTQNMSLNSMVTHDGSEIAMIQVLQSRASNITRISRRINPILLKPKGNTVSQVIVDGKPYGDYDVTSYYNDFVPGPGMDAVRESISYLRKRYDYVVMEGAGSPAEINLYDKDIANMIAADIADASCILVVNTEWGGSFAYALGTVALMPPEDRKRVKGVLFNNLRGDPAGFTDGFREFETISGIPVLGVVPHLDIELPMEDSSFFGRPSVERNGSMRVCVIKLPMIANFTDFDPLYMEDVTLDFVTDPADLKDADAVIIPGTKNTMSDLHWMRTSGMADAVLGMVSRIPILGICGGYQMMSLTLKDPKGIENIPTEMDGLGIFRDVTEWSDRPKITRQVSGKLIATGGDVRGYEIHHGNTVIGGDPLFRIDDFRGSHDEGSSDPGRMVFGTYMHGVFDAPAFRRYFLSFSSRYHEVPVKDYSEKVEENIQKLADGFAASVDMGLLKRILEADE